jgi:hypothetical protein
MATVAVMGKIKTKQSLFFFINHTSRIRVPTVRIPDAGLPSLTFK